MMGLRSDSVAGVRFLAAVCEGRGIKPAARSMGIHSWTGYRWLREAFLAHRCNGLRSEAAQSQVGFFTAKALLWEEEFLAGLGDGRHHLPVRVSRRPSGRARPGQGNRALSAALELCRPRNWWGTGASQSLLRAARSEGLPLSWVPRSEIIVELDGCADDKARLHVLESRRGLILQDCEDTLGECTDEWGAMTSPSHVERSRQSEPVMTKPAWPLRSRWESHVPHGLRRLVREPSGPKRIVRIGRRNAAKASSRGRRLS